MTHIPMPLQQIGYLSDIQQKDQTYSPQNKTTFTEHVTVN